MSIFCLPSSVNKEIDKLCMNFLWGDSAKKERSIMFLGGMFAELRGTEA